MRDTDPEVEKQYARMINARSAEQRIKMATRMHHTARRFVLAAIQREHPDLTPAQTRGQLLLRFYGDDFDEATLRKIAAAMPDMELNFDDAP